MRNKTSEISKWLWCSVATGSIKKELKKMSKYIIQQKVLFHCSSSNQSKGGPLQTTY